MAFKMKGFSGFGNSPVKKKFPIGKGKTFDLDKITDEDDQRFLDKQREERVKYSELDAKGKAIYNKNRKKSSKKAPDQAKFSDLEKFDEDKG